MNNYINTILKELYEIDPQLKSQEKYLTQLIEAMIKSKPDTRFDEKFKTNLKKQIILKINQSKKMKKQKIFSNLNFWRGFSLAATILIVVLLLVPLLNLPINQEITNQTGKLSFNASRLQINNLPDQSFGILNNNVAADSQTEAIQPSAQTATGFGGGGMSTSSSVAPNFPTLYTVYKYSYDGEPLEITQNELPVLKRVKGYDNTDYSSWLKDLNLDLLDTSQFSNLKIQHLALVEDKDLGYLVDINPYEGSVNITENYQRPWIDYNQSLKPLTYADVPDDQTLINIADNFINKYKIDLTDYGQPEVEKQPFLLAEKATTPEQMFVPNIISVRYPFMIDGKPVYEQGGTKNGIFVSINLYNKKAAGVYGLFTRNYDSSNYQVETNTQRILDFAKNGGTLFGAYEGPEANVVELKLGTPSQSYMISWQYKNNENNELLVPAYIFPVEPVDNNQNYYPKNIVVPIIKDILDSYQTNDIMPLRSDSATSNIISPAPDIQP